MKTSKIILLSFLSLVGLALLSALITVDHKRNSIEKETVEETFGNIRVIKAGKGVSVTIRSAETNLLSLHHYKDSTYVMPYEIVGDTLLLKPHKQNQGNWHYNVNINSPVSSIINNGGHINLKLKQDSLQVVCDQQGRFDVYNESSLVYLNLIVNEDSRSHLRNSSISRLDLRVDGSRVNINNKIEDVYLSAINKADVTMQTAGKLKVECDASSRYRIY